MEQLKEDSINIKKELAVYLNKQIEKIKAGYEIVDREADGCDDGGNLYWVDCKNNWSGREHDIDSQINKDIFLFLNNFCNSGTVFYCNFIYLDDKICFRKSIAEDDIKIITKEEYLKNNEMHLKLENIKERFLKYKMSKKYYLQYKYPFEELLTSNVDNFNYSLKLLLNNYYLEILKDKEFINLSNDEIKLLKINI